MRILLGQRTEWETQFDPQNPLELLSEFSLAIVDTQVLRDKFDNLGDLCLDIRTRRADSAQFDHELLCLRGEQIKQ